MTAPELRPCSACEDAASVCDAIALQHFAEREANINNDIDYLEIYGEECSYKAGEECSKLIRSSCRHAPGDYPAIVENGKLRKQAENISGPWNHEKEPHCIGCWVIEVDAAGPFAKCNECGERRDLLPMLSAAPPEQKAVDDGLVERHWVYAAAEAHRPLLTKAVGTDAPWGFNHLSYMLTEIAGMRSTTKACRWLGWVQACLLFSGCATLEELKAINKSASEAAAALSAQKAAPQSSTAVRLAAPSQEGVGQGETACAAPLPKGDLVRDLREEADLCRNETATDIAVLLDKAASEIERLRSERDGRKP